uniref:Uncharacterized protein n=1 Tax=Ananas comosus var. bracteatus TaxID=296719 RepID=A0A6V7Q0C3_ANACO|nr:unnamed protein product [Ananas comosus var. bracteatus]
MENYSILFPSQPCSSSPPDPSYYSPHDDHHLNDHSQIFLSQHFHNNPSSGFMVLKELKEVEEEAKLTHALSYHQAYNEAHPNMEYSALDDEPARGELAKVADEKSKKKGRRRRGGRGTPSRRAAKSTSSTTDTGGGSMARRL